VKHSKYVNPNKSLQRKEEDEALADTPRGDNLLPARRPDSLTSSKGHWNSTISDLTSEIIKLVEECDGAIWNASWEAVKREHAMTQYTRGFRKPQGLNLLPAMEALAAEKPKLYQSTKQAWEGK
jgi:hypothetical protein